MLGGSKSVEATFELRNFLDETGGLPETLRSFFWKSSILDSEKKMLWYSTPILETAQMATVNDFTYSQCGGLDQSLHAWAKLHFSWNYIGRHRREGTEVCNCLRREEFLWSRTSTLWKMWILPTRVKLVNVSNHQIFHNWSPNQWLQTYQMSKIPGRLHSKSLHLGPHQAPMQGDGGLSFGAPSQARPRPTPPKKTTVFWRFLERPSPVHSLVSRALNMLKRKPPHAS